MITPTDLQQLKAKLRGLVVEDVPATLAALKEALPADTPRMGEVLTLEGQFQELKKNQLRQTISVENQQLISNQIRSNLVDLIAALEVDDFDPVRRSVTFAPRRKRMLYVTLALAIAGFLALVIYWPKVDGGEWFTLPANRSGQLLYHIPPQMALQEEMSCIVRIAFDSVDLVRDLSLSDVKIEEIRTTSKMKVELVDAQSEPVFQIRNVLGDDEQFIEEGDYTEWIFGVTPLVAGTHQLLLKVTVLKKIDGEYVPKNLSFSKEIEIVTDDLAPTEMTFENSGQIIAEASAEALVQTVEQERQRREEEWSNIIEELLRKDDTALGGLFTNLIKGDSTLAGGWNTELDPIQVYFPYNSTTLISDDKLEAILSTLVKGIAPTNLKLLLVGHTDDRGTSTYNLQLGRQRAAAVRAKLVELGLESEQVQISSKGEAQPVAPNATETGRAQNRRVEIRLLKY